jgi:hypothetical protein
VTFSASSRPVVRLMTALLDMAELLLGGWI